jgi:SAM-dependent methyltransferase
VNGIVPKRRRGVELLDDPAIDPAVRARSIGDVVRSNRLFGGRRAAVRAIIAAARSVPTTRVTLLDVGTGLADIPLQAEAAATTRGARMTTIGLDSAGSLLAHARGRVGHAVCGSALDLPMADGAVDVAATSQLLHHFEERDALTVLRELDRVARHAVVVSDLRRSWIAAGGFWVASWILGFHAVTRHDGVVSVLRGFTASELAALIERATGARPQIRRRFAFRLVAVWTPRR